MKHPDELHVSITDLRSKEGSQRELARQKIVSIGKPAVHHLIELLKDRDPRIRWEACMALKEIRDPAAIVPLVRILDDEDQEVRWLAAEALIVMGEKSVIPLLQRLEVEFDSVYLRQSARHILFTLNRHKELTGNLGAVLKLLRRTASGPWVAIASKDALDSYRRPHL